LVNPAKNGPMMAIVNTATITNFKNPEPFFARRAFLALMSFSCSARFAGLLLLPMGYLSYVCKINDVILL
jgi:hypothetical protein